MRSRLGARALVGLINGYRRFISPAVGPRCRFVPSCSEFATQAISRHGALKGVVLSVVRLLRCHPFNEGGFDLVPQLYRIRYRQQGGSRSVQNRKGQVG